jgi:hypothetical protein
MRHPLEPVVARRATYFFTPNRLLILRIYSGEGLEAELGTAAVEVGFVFDRVGITMLVL